MTPDLEPYAMRLVIEHMKLHRKLRELTRRSAGLPAGNLVTRAFRRRSPRSPRS